MNRYALAVTTTALSMVLMGCSMLGSSFHYTKGTEALERGDYCNAICHLEQAVQLDPIMARNQTNLAVAYAANGDLNEGWSHALRGIELDPYDEIAWSVFHGIYCKLDAKYQIEATRPCPTQLKEYLGAPDAIITPTGVSDFYWYRYGPYGFGYKGENLIKITKLSGFPNPQERTLCYPENEVR